MSNNRPQNRKEFMSKLAEPADKTYGNPNKAFSEPKKEGRPEYNRALEISVKSDNDKNFSVGIKDIDEAVMYYFNNVLKLSVIQNNAKVMVPVLYGTPENWKSVQADGYYRDGYGKLMAPLLMFRRVSMTQNRNMGNKLDGNYVKNVQLFERPYSKRNIYSRFDIMNNRGKEKEYIVTVTPDYVTIQYDCILWTHFVEQMDKLVESVNYASRSYWGDPNKFNFYADIESFTDNITYDIGEDRAVRTSFSITLNGYLIPNSLNAEISKALRVFSASKIVFGFEVADSAQELESIKGKPAERSLAKVVTADSVNRTIISTESMNPQITDYLNANVSVQGVYVSPSVIRFNSNMLVAPSPLPATNVENFTFFCNGQYIERTSIVSFVQQSGYCELTVDSNLLQYSFEPSDTVVALGKFQ
jgi:hypothetical protein